MKQFSKYLSFKIENLLIPLLAIRHIFKISEEVYPYIHHDTTLDFVNAFVSPGVNSRAELVLSHGAVSRG
jgi:hypothetical protein